MQNGINLFIPRLETFRYEPMPKPVSLLHHPITLETIGSQAVILKTMSGFILERKHLFFALTKNPNIINLDFNILHITKDVFP
jgi:hypothetical protein